MCQDLATSTRFQTSHELPHALAARAVASKCFATRSTSSSHPAYDPHYAYVDLDVRVEHSKRTMHSGSTCASDRKTCCPPSRRLKVESPVVFDSRRSTVIAIVWYGRRTERYQSLTLHVAVLSDPQQARVIGVIWPYWSAIHTHGVCRPFKCKLGGVRAAQT